MGFHSCVTLDWKSIFGMYLRKIVSIAIMLGNDFIVVKLPAVLQPLELRNENSKIVSSPMKMMPLLKVITG